MSEVHDHPVETAAVEPAPAADGTSPAVDTVSFPLFTEERRRVGEETKLVHAS